MDLLRRLWHLARAQLPAGKSSSWEEPVSGPAFEASWQRAREAAPAPVVDSQLAQYYANLEIPYGADLETARRAWKRLLKKCHPDLHATNPEKRRVADELSARLTQAYQELERALKAKENS